MPVEWLFPKLYTAWALVAIGLSLVAGGLKAENVTRLAVITFLGLQIPLRDRLTRALPGLAPRTRFVLMGMLLAAVVEAFHMNSMPVFLSLRIDDHTPWLQGLMAYGLDLLFTEPAYLVIFLVIWRFIRLYRYTFWQYVFVMGLGQTATDFALSKREKEHQWMWLLSKK